MATYAALTPTPDPPQMEFIPTDSSHKYPKVTNQSLIFKFSNPAVRANARRAASHYRGFGLHRVTLRDLRTGQKEQATLCDTLAEFMDALDYSLWCKKCQRWTKGTGNTSKKCWRCKRQL